MKTKEKVKKFYKEHKDEINIGVTVGVALVFGVVLGKKIRRTRNAASIALKSIEVKPEVPKVIRNLPQELLDMGFEEYGNYGNAIEFANYGIEVASNRPDDMHKVIDIIENMEGFTENSGIQAMFNVYGLE